MKIELTINSYRRFGINLLIMSFTQLCRYTTTSGEKCNRSMPNDGTILCFQCYWKYLKLEKILYGKGFIYVTANFLNFPRFILDPGSRCVIGVYQPEDETVRKQLTNKEKLYAYRLRLPTLSEDAYIQFVVDNNKRVIGVQDEDSDGDEYVREELTTKEKERLKEYEFLLSTTDFDNL